MNDLKSTIEAKIAQHKAAIGASGQVADGTHAHLTALMAEPESFSGFTESMIAEVKTVGDLTRTQTMEEFRNSGETRSCGTPASGPTSRRTGSASTARAKVRAAAAAAARAKVAHA